MSALIRCRTGLALAAVAAAVSTAAPAAAQTPDKVIDAQADPDGAAAALNAGCADTTKCRFDSESAPVRLDPDDGVPSMLGDVLYNCDDTEYAETAVGTEEEQQETTSLSEKLSLKVSLGFLDLEKNSVEFSVFSKQSEAFSVSVQITNAVSVPPGWKGWTVSRPISVYVPGSAYISSGIQGLVQVKNFDLSFPFPDPNADPKTWFVPTGNKVRMTPAEIRVACDPAVEATKTLLGQAQATTGRFSVGSSRVSGVLPPDVSRAAVRVSRAGRTVARGTLRGGRVRLANGKRLRRGRYRLTLIEKQRRTRPGQLDAIKSLVPITVR